MPDGVMNTMKKRIMIFCDFYLPGFKSGGGMWTVVNLVDRFNDKYDFFIVTRNYDSKGDKKKFETVRTDDWNEVNGAKVYYFADGSLTPQKTADLVNEIAPDAFFVNSALSLPVFRLLTARRKKLFKEIPFILAPCGEMSEGALSVKPLKKKIFLKYADIVDLYKGVIWKGSFASEAYEIRKMMGDDVEVMVAPDLVPHSIIPDYDQAWKPRKEKGSVKFVFISRLVPKKNISYFLERLCDIKSGNVEFDIIGPLEDQSYWKHCQSLIADLPENIKVNVTGAFPDQRDALRRVCDSHFFAMPTLNENFGYVFIEGLAAGCPLLISDRTVWSDIEEKGVGWRIPLERPDLYLEQIDRCIQMENDEYLSMSVRARQYAVDWLAKPEINEATARVLDRALDQRSVTANDGR